MGAIMKSKVMILILTIGIFASDLAAAAGAAQRGRRSSLFIHSSCRSTRYPAICEQSLASYAPLVRHSPRQLAHAAVSVSVTHARAASTYVYRLSGSGKSPRAGEAGAVRDCLEVLSDSVDRLKRSAKEMNRMGRFGSARFRWHLSNVQTWVSAALTDQGTCLESLAQDRKSADVRAQIRRQIAAVERVTSNALALVNRLGGN